MPTKKRDPIWRYFSHNLKDENARCIFEECKDKPTIAVPKHSTKSLKLHLSTNHPTEYKNYEQDRKAEQEKRKSEKEVTQAAPSSSNQRMITDTFKKVNLSPKRIEEIDRLITEMIAIDFEPFRVVDREGWRRLISNLEPGYQIRSREFYKETVFPKIYDGLVLQIKSKLTEAEYFAFTTDTWSDTTANVELMSLTCHSINENFDRRNLTLGTEVLKVSPTADNLAAVLLQLFEKWQIRTEKEHIVLRDGAKNMEKMMLLVGILDEWCIANILQLIINSGLFAQRAISDMLSRARGIAGHFNHSVQAVMKLNSLQKELNEPILSPVQDIPTRWNSTFYMLNRFLRIKKSILHYVGVSTTLSHKFSPNDWALMESVCDLLKPFEAVTLEVSKEDALISVTIPVVKGLLKFITSTEFPGAGTTKDVLLEQIRIRLGHIEGKKHLTVATYLDPRFKTWELESHTVLSVKATIRGELQLSRESSPAVEISPPKKPKESDRKSCWSMFASVTYEPDEAGPSTGDEDQLEKEMRIYEKEARVPVESGSTAALEWWKEKKDNYRLLAKIARKYLCAPPSTVPSERVFSKVGNIYGPKRNRLHGEKADMLLFLNTNLRDCNYSYKY